MAKQNIFNLSKMMPKSVDVEVTNSSSATSEIEQDALLHNYELIDPANWHKLPFRAHIRYLRKDGAFRKGGFVKAVTQTQDLEGKETIKIDLVANFTPNAVSWSIFKGSIDKLWKKIDMTGDTPLVSNVNIEQINEIKEDITFCKNSIEQIKKELQKMSNEQIRTIMLIKKMHGL